MHAQQQAIVIGSGVAGLAVSARLASMGYRVRVYEKNDVPGGKLSVFEQNGFRFDAGPSLFTQPEILDELFAETGEKLEDYFSYKPVDTSCQYFFENGKRIRAFTSRQAFADELQQVTGEDPARLHKYLNQSEKLYNHVGQIFLNHSLHKASTWLNKRIFPALKTVHLSQLAGTLNAWNQKHFKSPEARQLFNRYATYNGSNPYKAPGMLSLIPHLEQNIGTFYPKGGMISITEALYQLALKKGVEFYFNTPVDRIIHHDRKVIGVVVNHENIAADVVVSNSDIYFTYRDLLHNVPKSRKLLKQERSSSALVFYWGMNREFPDLHLHNIFFSNNYREEFDQIFRNKNLHPDPTVYINITAKMEAGHAPSGMENWFVMINAPENIGQDWNELVRNSREQVISKLSRILQTDLTSHITTEHILDPVQIESATTGFRGSLYGTSSNSKMAAFARHPNFCSPVKGLYFCGGTVHPGGGIPLCLKSARIVAGLVKHDRKKNHD